MKTWQLFVPIFTALLEVHSQVYTSSPEDCFSPMNCQDRFAQLEAANLSAESLGTVSTRDMEDGDGVLIIIPDMTFNCSGSVSSWTGILSIFDADSEQSLASQDLEMSFQIWRLLSDGSFGLIGSQQLIFDSVTIGERLVQPTSEVAASEMHHYHPFMVNSTSDDSIDFQAGDVVGCFIPAPANSSTISVGLSFRNTSIHDAIDTAGGAVVDMLVFPVSGNIVNGAVVSCGESRVVIPSVLPQIYPHYEWFDGDFGSGSGTQNSVVPTACPTVLVTTGTVLVTTGTVLVTTGGTKNNVVRGLFAVVASVCVIVACVVGVIANIVTFCVARKKRKRTERTRETPRRTRIEANWPFIYNQQAEEANQGGEGGETTGHSVLNLTSLEEFFELQYSLQSDSNAESNRISWV